MAYKLPNFRGYTVDEMLRQFRKIDINGFNIESIDFDSEKGQQLLAEIETDRNITEICNKMTVEGF